jgi:hypothetical protein
MGQEPKNAEGHNGKVAIGAFGSVDLYWIPLGAAHTSSGSLAGSMSGRLHLSRVVRLVIFTIPRCGASSRRHNCDRAGTDSRIATVELGASSPRARLACDGALTFGCRALRSDAGREVASRIWKGLRPAPSG